MVLMGATNAVGGTARCFLRSPLLLRRGLSQQSRAAGRSYSFVPEQPVARSVTPRAAVNIPIETVQLLEKLSLVRFGEAEAVTQLQEAVVFAQAIFDVDTTGVEPMYTIHEDRGVLLRDDVVEHCDPRLVLNNAPVIEEGFILAPPGNIPLEQDKHAYGYLASNTALPDVSSYDQN